MRVKIHCKKFDTEFKMALYGMVEFAMARLVESKRLRKHISIDVHFRHHSAEGEAMIDISELLLTIIVLKKTSMVEPERLLSGLTKSSRLSPTNWFM